MLDKAVEPTLDLSEDAKTYTVELPEFEGPLDLLLTLIEQEELDVTRIALAYVTDQYLTYLDVLRKVNPDELTDFLVVAAKLILIKSQVLLPRPPPGIFEEEEEDIGDELARQLLAYKQFKEVAAKLRTVEERGWRNYIRLTPPHLKIEPRLIPGEVSLADLLEAARQAMAVKPPEPDVNKMVSPEIVTIGQQMAHIRQEMKNGRRISLQTLLAKSRSRIEIIVTLLAVLELIKRHVVQVDQSQPFSDIIIYRNPDSPEMTEAEWGELTGLTDVS